MSDQLYELARPFPSRYVKTNPSGGGSYVAHPVVKQRLLHILGAYDFELVEVIRGDLPGKAPNPQAQSKRGKDGTPALTGAVVGVICRLSVTVDGQRRVIEEVGDCEEPYNWPHDGARLKDAMSDAIKRCAAHLGLGLHLWAQEQYFLFDALTKDRKAESGATPEETPANPSLPIDGTDEGSVSADAPSSSRAKRTPASKEAQP